MQDQTPPETVKRLLLYEQEVEKLRIELSKASSQAYEADFGHKNQLREMQAKKEEIEEELTRYQN